MRVRQFAFVSLLILPGLYLWSCSGGDSARETPGAPPSVQESAAPTPEARREPESQELKEESSNLSKVSASPDKVESAPVVPKPPPPSPAPKASAANAPPTDKPAETVKEKVKVIEPAAALLDPSLANEKAPESFKVRMETTKGPFVLEVTRAWSPHGADRFYNLVKMGFFNDTAFFRIIEGFIVQFGINGDPKVNAKWISAAIQDDPVTQSNTRGTITFATGGPNTRTSQLFINLVDNTMLDSRGFSPFGKVVEGMSVVDSLYGGYGEGAPQGRGPAQQLIQSQGNAYLKAQFPQLDYVKTAALVK